MSRYVSHLTNAYLPGHNRNPDQITPKKADIHSSATAKSSTRATAPAASKSGFRSSR